MCLEDHHCSRVPARVACVHDASFGRPVPAACARARCSVGLVRWRRRDRQRAMHVRVDIRFAVPILWLRPFGARASFRRFLHRVAGQSARYSCGVGAGAGGVECALGGMAARHAMVAGYWTSKQAFAGCCPHHRRRGSAAVASAFHGYARRAGPRVESIRPMQLSHPTRLPGCRSRREVIRG